jgi:hypothetical protein
MNKKGQIQDILYVIVILFVIAIIFYFFSHIFFAFYGEFQTVLGNSPTLDEGGEAAEALSNIQTAESSAWDYGFLGIFASYVLLIGIFSFSSRINPIFFWIAVIMSTLGLLIGVILSNTWQQIAINPELVSTTARFPITNAIMGTYYPSVITFIIVIGLILIFGKPLEGR